MRFNKRLGIGLLLGLLLWSVSTVAAAPVLDRVVGANERVSEELTLFGEDLVVTAGGVVEADVVLMGGDANIAGIVTGDLVLFGGDLTLEETAVIRGECVVLGGEISGSAETSPTCTRPGGDVIPPLSGLTSEFSPFGGAGGELTDMPEAVLGVGPGGFLGVLGGILGQTIALSLLAVLFAGLMPAQLKRVGDVIQARPVMSGTVGSLTAVAGISLITLLAVISSFLLLIIVGVLGFPVVLALATLLAGAALFGLVAIGRLLGERLAAQLQLRNRSIIVTATLGTAVLTLLGGFLIAQPVFPAGIIGWLFGTALLTLGLGATALTKFGTRPYPLLGGDDDFDDELIRVLGDGSAPTIEKTPEI